jgi:hypothetical protein
MLNNKSPYLLTSEIFDAFIKLEQYELNAIETETKKPVTDGLILFYIVKEKHFGLICKMVQNL